VNNLAFVVLAAGQGSRMMSDTPKQFMRVAGKTILEHTIDNLNQCAIDARMIVVVPVEAKELTTELLHKYPLIEIISGGSNRQASTQNALLHLAKNPPEKVIIHDAARPFISCQIVAEVIKALDHHEAVDVAIPTADTVIIERDGFIQSIPKRTHILRGQTPQGFHFTPLLQAYIELGEEKLGDYTDDCGIFLACHPMSKIRIIKGSSENIKITDAIDLVLADELFRIRSEKWNPERLGLDVRGKHALIFGGSKGIGRAIQQILKESECKVAIASKSLGCDVTIHQDVANVVSQTQAQFGKIDYVVNCVGMLAKQALHLQSNFDVENLIKVNFLGAINIAKASYQSLRNSRGMLLQTSSSSYTRGRAGYTPYSASKAAVVNLTQGLADEWEKDHIRVNCLVPGRTDTDMRREHFKDEPALTLLSPYEVALAACKLLSTNNTGVILRS